MPWEVVLLVKHHIHMILSLSSSLKASTWKTWIKVSTYLCLYLYMYRVHMYTYVSNKGPQNHTYHTHVSYELRHYCHTRAITPYPVCPVQCRSRRHCDVRTGRRYSCGDLLFWHNGMTKNCMQEETISIRPVGGLMGKNLSRIDKTFSGSSKSSKSQNQVLLGRGAHREIS